MTEARARMARVEQRLSEVRERIEALTAQLPNQSTVDEATERAAKLTRDALQARKRWESAWTRLLSAVRTDLRPAISALARAEYEELIGTRADLVGEYGVSVKPLHAITPNATDAADVALVGHALVDVPYGGMREIVARDWKNAS